MLFVPSLKVLFKIQHIALRESITTLSKAAIALPKDPHDTHPKSASLRMRINNKEYLFSHFGEKEALRRSDSDR